MKQAMLLWAGVLLLWGSAVGMAGQAPMIPNSLHDAKVGEWALYKTPNGYEQKHTVVKVDGRGPNASVVVRIDSIYKGEVVQSVEVHHEAGEPTHPFVMPDGAAPTGKIEIENKTVSVKGKPVRATVVEVDNDDNDEMKWVLSDAIPVFGLIKQEADDENEYELIDYGEN